MAFSTRPVYGQFMAKKTLNSRSTKTGEKSKLSKGYSNRIRELTKTSKLTYAIVGEKLGAHETTIADLARGETNLTQDWMEKLATVFNVPPQQIIWPPEEPNLRKVSVKSYLQAGHWREAEEWDLEDHYSVMVPDDKNLRSVVLYAAEIRGPSMNKRYPDKSVVVMATMSSTYEGVKEGKRYHVRQTRADGKAEETVKTLARDDMGKLWLKPESTHPEFQQWIPLEGSDGSTIEILGRVRYAVLPEE